MPSVWARSTACWARCSASRAGCCWCSPARCVAGVTDVPKQDWWQNSILAPHFAAAALSLRPYLPRDWADRLDYSAAGSLPTAPGPAAEPGVQRI